MASSFHSLDDRRQHCPDLVVSHPRHQGKPSWPSLVSLHMARRVVRHIRVELLHISNRFLRRRRGPNLEPHWVGDQGSEVDVEIVDTPGALTNPYFVCGEIVEGGFPSWILAQAQHGALIIDDEGFVGTVDIGRVQIRVRDLTCLHEAQAMINF